MPSELGLHAIQEGLTQSGYGGVLPFLPFLFFGAGGVLIYFGFAWLPEELSTFPSSYYVMGWESPLSAAGGAVGMIIVGAWLIYLAYESSS